jgi:hypothetical protein
LSPGAPNSSAVIVVNSWKMNPNEIRKSQEKRYPHKPTMHKKQLNVQTKIEQRKKQKQKLDSHKLG